MCYNIQNDACDFGKTGRTVVMKKRVRNKKKIIIWLSIAVLSISLVVFPVISVTVYELIFGNRYETAAWAQFSVDEYEGLQVERSDFSSDDVTLAGYKYTKEGVGAKGVVILSHGLGGGHNTYMPFIDRFTANGYYVFAYDARGNDNSEGEDVEGLPQGLIDLDNAIKHAATIDEYQNLPVALFGHSWGGYAVGNVLNLHPEVKAAVIVAGFNESEDMIAYHGEDKAGKGSLIMMPYLRLYEQIKFGKTYAQTSAVEGMGKTEADILIVHSRDDATVPVRYGYDKFYEAYGNDTRFDFILHENRGHQYPLYSDAAFAYRERLNQEYLSYIETTGKEDNEENKNEFMYANLDKKQCFEPDPMLLDRMLALFDACCVN